MTTPEELDALPHTQRWDGWCHLLLTRADEIEKEGKRG
jgi:hypothetical protein